MDVPLNEVIFFDAITSNPTTGAAVDADSTPTFAVYEESTDTDIGVGGNLTKRTSLTGNYRGTFTASAANGFEVGKWYSVIGSATVGAVAGKAVLKNFRVTAAELTAGYPVIDVVKVLGTTLTEGAGGRLAGGMVAFFNVGSPVLTVASVNQTGDAYGIVNSGTHGNAAIHAKTTNLPSDPADQSIIIAATDALATLIGDVPTNAELATALGTADDAVLAQVALVAAKTDLIPAGGFPTNFPTLSINAAGRVKVQEGLNTNVALANFEFLLVSSSDHSTPVTGATVTATRSIDGAAFGACANAVTEVANGVYKISLAATDLNGATITFKFSASGADQRTITIVPAA